MKNTANKSEYEAEDYITDQINFRNLTNNNIKYIPKYVRMVPQSHTTAITTLNNSNLESSRHGSNFCLTKA